MIREGLITRDDAEKKEHDLKQHINKDIIKITKRLGIEKFKIPRID